MNKLLSKDSFGKLKEAYSISQEIDKETKQYCGYIKKIIEGEDCPFYGPCDIGVCENCNWNNKDALEYISLQDNTQIRQFVEINGNSTELLFLGNESKIGKDSAEIVLLIGKNKYIFNIDYILVKDTKLGAANEEKNVLKMYLKSKHNNFNKNDLKEIEHFIYIYIINNNKINTFL